MRNPSTWGREMKRKDGGTTSPLLLKRVADWADHRAGPISSKAYDLLIRSWCGGYRLDDGTPRRPLPANLDRAGGSDAHVPVRSGQDVSRLAPAVLPFPGG